MNGRRYHTVSGAVFALIALLQALRALMQVPIPVGGTAIPVWISWAAAAVAGSLAVWAFQPHGMRAPAA